MNRDQIERPVAHAVLTWLPPEQGGRRSGPPTAPVYMATAQFQDRPATADLLSVLLQRLPGTAETEGVYKVDFLARDLARPFLRPGAEMLITEGPRVVATAVVRDVLVEDHRADGTPVPY